ncbi:MAG: LysR substrate-binding domain-containing protein [Gemmatimonadota bacterium]
MPTLRQFRYLDALAREGHFGRAAAASGVTQAALSMQIRKLEDRLGATVVETSTRGHVFTETGMEVLRRGRQILAAVDDLKEFARTDASGLSGTLRLGVIPTIAPYLLPRALPALRHRFPEVTLELREARTSTLLTELERGGLDLLLLSLPIEGTGLQTLFLFHDRFFLAVEASGEWDAAGRVSMDDLASLRLLLLSDGHCLRDQALQACRLAERSVMDQLGATSLATLLQMVAHGMGVTLLPEMAAAAEIRDDRVRLLRFQDPEPSREIGLVWRRTSPHGRRYRALGQLLVEIGSDPATTDVKEHLHLQESE